MRSFAPVNHKQNLNSVKYGSPSPQKINKTIFPTETDEQENMYKVEIDEEDYLIQSGNEHEEIEKKY